MIHINGAYADAVVFTDAIEAEARQQIQELCNQPFVEGSRIRVMPDAHPGKGCVIGLTMTYADKIVPNLVGVDIGCGIRVTRIQEKTIDSEKLDHVIRRHIPSGFHIRIAPHELSEQASLSGLHAIAHVDADRARHSIGTLGGGNHFIEIASDGENFYLLIHSGSRHPGKQIAEHYQRLAARNTAKAGVPKHLAYVEGEPLAQYLDDLKIAQQYASLNRAAMTDMILTNMGWTAVDSYETVHNYVDIESKIIRKGAVSAKRGEAFIIPINMRDGSLLCTGKGNEDWNESAPHGAGRIMSRGEARRMITMAQYEKAMNGIFSTVISPATIDEAPFAYKPMEEILSHIGPAATLVAVIKPIYNFKGA